MATSPPTETQNIQLQGNDEQDSAISLKDENKLRRWLQRVDDHIDQSSLEIMKLGLRTDLSQVEREKATKASELYNALEEKHDADIALARFVHALEKLGHRRHGFRAVRQLKEFSIEKPAQYNPTGSQLEQEFNFFQCLVEICVHLDAKHHSRLSAYSAKMFLDGTNPKKIKTPCALLTELVEKRVIKTEDQSNLVEGLEIVGADRCIEHIHRYRHLNNLSEITEGDYTQASGTWRSTTSSITEEGTLSRTHTLGRQIQEQGSQTNMPPLSERAGDPGQQLLESQSGQQSRPVRGEVLNEATELQAPGSQNGQQSRPEHGEVLNEATELQALESQNGQQSRPEHSEVLNEATDKNKGNKKRKCKTRCVLIGCALPGCGLALCIALLIAYGVIQDMKNRTTTSLYYENTTVILTEVGHLFTSSLRVTQDTKHIGDFYRDIEIYQRDSSCSDLPTLRQTPPITQYGTDISAINGTTFYALPGSSVTYNICAITNYTTTELERLELLLHKGSLSQPIAIDFFHVGTNEKWQCKESTLHFDKPAYYVITFLPPTHEATFMFNATYDVREIDTEQLYETATANHTLRNDEDTSEFDNLKFSNTYSCFVATIKDNPHTLKQTVHIRLQHSMQKWLFIIGGLVIFAFLVGTLVLSAIILCCLCLFNKGCTTRF